MPLYPILIAIGSITTEPAVAALAVNVASFLGFGVLTYLISKRYWIGFVASFFPYFLYKYSVYVYADIPAFFLAALSYYFLTKNRPIHAILFGSLAVAAHYLVLLVVPAFAYALYRRRAEYAPFGLIPTIAFIIMSLLKLLYVGDFIYYVHANLRVWTRAGGGSYGFLAVPFASFLYVFTHLNALVSSWVAVNILYALVIFLPVYLFFGLGAYFAYIDKAFLDLAWGLPVFFFIIVLSPVGFFYAPRYGVLAFPLLLHLAISTKNNAGLKSLLVAVAIGNLIYSVASIILFPLPTVG